MSQIKDIFSREILDSRGNPTVEVEVLLKSGHIGRASVPSGASTGAFEAYELRDEDSHRYYGKGVLRALKNIQQILKPLLIGKSVEDQSAIDALLICKDGSSNKSQLGANAILGISMACAVAKSKWQEQSLFKSFEQNKDFKLPVPLMNILNGGAHADNQLDVQEFMIVPWGFSEFKEALRAGSEVFQSLKKILHEKKLSISVGDEGGFAPHLSKNKQALELAALAIEKAGYKLGDQISLALDVASTEFFKGDNYLFEQKNISGEELGEIYKSWAKEFPILSIEDGFAEDDWSSWIQFTKECGDQIQLVGDDLFVTNVKRLKKGIEQKAANALLVKVNQIGTLTETLNATCLAHKAGFKTVMSHRSGETEDVIIADLSVAMNCEQIKTGSLCRGERTAKYNQLLRIEEELGSQPLYWGKKAFF